MPSNTTQRFCAGKPKASSTTPPRSSATPSATGSRGPPLSSILPAIGAATTCASTGKIISNPVTVGESPSTCWTKRATNAPINTLGKKRINVTKMREDVWQNGGGGGNRTGGADAFEGAACQ